MTYEETLANQHRACQRLADMAPAVAAELGPEWTGGPEIMHATVCGGQLVRAGDHPMTVAFHLGDKGRISILVPHIHTEGFTGSDGRYHPPTWPDVYKDGHRITPPRITVNGGSDAKRIARQIVLRIMPDAEVYLTAALARLAADEDHNNRTLTNARDLARVGRGRIDRNSTGSEISVFTAHQHWRVCGDSIRLEHTSFDADTALAVAELLAHLYAKKKG